MVVRDGDDGLEVLLLERSTDSPFAPGAHVFPGGALDADDHDPLFTDDLEPSEVAALDRRLDVAAGGGAWIAAAVRECFEEAGLLLATRISANRRVLGSDELASLRVDLAAGRASFAQLLRALAITIDPAQLHYVSHWITPESSPRRFDARFFVAVAPEGQPVTVDGHEIVGHQWIRPSVALATNDGGVPLLRPTRENLSMFATVGSVAALRDAIAARGPIRTIAPRSNESAMPPPLERLPDPAPRPTDPT